MAKRAEVIVKGGPELAAGSRRLFGKIEPAAIRRLRGVAERGVGAVRGRVPRRTGRLAGSVAAGETEHAATLTMGTGHPTSLYAGWIEFGGTRGRPFVARGRYLYPTALEQTPMVVLAARAAAEQEIRGFSWPKVL